MSYEVPQSFADTGVLLLKHECHFVSGISQSKFCVFHNTTESAIIMKWRLSLTLFCWKKLCFVPPRRILRMYQRQSHSYPETVNCVNNNPLDRCSRLYGSTVVQRPHSSQVLIFVGR